MEDGMTNVAPAKTYYGTNSPNANNHPDILPNAPNKMAVHRMTFSFFVPIQYLDYLGHNLVHGGNGVGFGAAD